MLDHRQAAILKTIIQDYTVSCQPVGSHAVVEKHDFPLSSATIRNEMGELESEGYITHPHTSAGRIPTAKGWAYYLEHFLEERTLGKREQRELQDAYQRGETPEERARAVAKKLAEQTSAATLLAFSPHDVYYTGLANLFAQPEFAHLPLIRQMSEIIDHLDEVLANLAPDITELRILVGDDNPFGDACGTILAPIRVSGVSVIGILGPVRMAYDANVGRIRYLQELFQERNAKIHEQERNGP